MIETQNVDLSLSKKISILLRCSLIQGAWNFKGLQNLGFYFATKPAKLGYQPQAFNSHPYMVPGIIGIQINLHRNNQTEAIQRLSPSINGTLAAIGDKFFWALIKPILGILGLIFAIHSNWIGLAAGLLIFNILHAWIMIWGFNTGYAQGPQAAITIGQTISNKRIEKLAIVPALLCGTALALGAGQFSTTLNPFLTSALFACFVFAMHYKLNIFYIFYGTFLIFLLWTTII